MVSLTIAEVVQVLEPPMTARQLHLIVSALHLKPTGKRHTGHAGRPAATYDASELLRLHAVLAPWLGS